MGRRLRTIVRHVKQAMAQTPTAPWLNGIIKADGDGDEKDIDALEKGDADDDAVDSGVLVDGEVKQSNSCRWFYGFDEEAKKAWRVPAGMS